MVNPLHPNLMSLHAISESWLLSYSRVLQGTLVLCPVLFAAFAMADSMSLEPYGDLWQSATSWLLASCHLRPTSVLKGLVAFILQLFVHSGVWLTAGALTSTF